MFAIDSLGGAAAFKNYLRLKCGRLYAMGFKKTDGEEGDLCRRCNLSRVNSQCVCKLPVNAVIFILKMEEVNSYPVEV